MEGLGIQHLQSIPGHLVSLDPAPRRVQGHEPHVVHGHTEVFVEGMLWAIQAAKAKTLARTPEGKSCAILKRVGRGQLLVLGFGLTHRFDYQVELIRHLMAGLGVKAKLDVRPWDVPVFVRTSANGTFVFACNPHEEARHVTVRVQLGKGWSRIPPRGTIALKPRSCLMLPVNLKLTDTIRLCSTTCEIRSIDRTTPLSLRLAVGRGERASLELTLPTSYTVTAQGALLTQRRSGRRCLLDVVASDDPVTLVLRKF